MLVPGGTGNGRNSPRSLRTACPSWVTVTMSGRSDSQMAPARCMACERLGNLLQPAVARGGVHGRVVPGVPKQLAFGLLFDQVLDVMPSKNCRRTCGKPGWLSRVRSDCSQAMLGQGAVPSGADLPTGKVSSNLATSPHRSRWGRSCRPHLAIRRPGYPARRPGQSRPAAAEWKRGPVRRIEQRLRARRGGGQSRSDL